MNGVCSSHIPQRQAPRRCHSWTPGFQLPGEGVQAAVGGGADGSGAFAQDLPGGAGVQAEDGAEQDGFGLVGGQGGDQGQGGVGGDGVDGVLGGVVVGGPAGQVFGGDGGLRGRRAARRRWSRARCLAMVAVQPRKWS